ncbi:MAG: chemotaxis protein CheX [Nitrospirae bacterium]|nr:chemotaxis protein CheX [Nitrospirota bacterium]
MRLDHINPFIEAARYVLSEISHLDIKGGEPSLKHSPIPTKDNVIIIGIAGDMEGRVIFEMDDKAALTLAGIMNNTKFEQLNPIAIDSLSELTNMMIGNAVSRLNDMGFNFTVTPPTFLKGRDMISSTSQIETLVINLSAEYGEVTLNIAVRYKHLIKRGFAGHSFGEDQGADEDSNLSFAGPEYRPADLASGITINMLLKGLEKIKRTV